MKIELTKEQAECSEMQQIIIDSIGEAAALEEVLKALPTDEKHEILEYIIRMNDLDSMDD